LSERPPEHALSREERAADPSAGLGASSLDRQVRAADPARWLASRFAPPEARKRLVALYAVHHEIARVREAVSDPLVGEIRLAWWSEAVEEAYETPDRARRHPAVLALTEALAPPAPRPPRDLFEALIDSRRRDLESRPFADAAEIARYAEATAGGLMRLAARLLAPGAELSAEIDAGLAAAGRAWGLAGLAVAFPAHASQGFVAVPDAPSGVEIHRMIEARDAAAVRAITAPLAAAAGEALAEARAALKGAAAALWPAYGYAALVEPRLKALGSADPFVLAAKTPGFVDRARLVMSAAAGRI
jgi:phytoene synthase